MEIIGENKNREWCDLIRSITLGIETNASWDIENFQTREGMKNYLENKKEISFSYLDHFEDDPVEEMRETLSKQIIIYYFDPFIQPMQKKDSIKSDLIAFLNELMHFSFCSLLLYLSDQSIITGWLYRPENATH